MSCISKASFQKPIRLRQKVELPELGLGAYAYLQELGARDLQELRKQYASPPPDAYFDFEFSLLARCLVDDAGTLLFASDSELREMSDLSVATLQRLAREALQLSGIDTQKN